MLRLGITLLILLCNLSAVYAVKAQPRANVQAFITAFNQKNITAMIQLTRPDVRWLFVDSKHLFAETTDQASLTVAMTDYFANNPSARSDILQMFTSNGFVSTVERASWQHKGELKQQCSLAIYQFEEDKIQTVWYYPAHQCDADSSLSQIID